MDKLDFDIHAFDARIWADAFYKMFPDHDKSTMLTWFANALMAGFDFANSNNANSNKWIDVKEALPEDDEGYPETEFLVICRTHGGMLPEGAYVSVHKAYFMPAREKDDDDVFAWKGNTTYWELLESENSIPFEVTHWMKIPKLPACYL